MQKKFYIVFFRKLKLLLERKIGLRYFYLETVSHLLNFTKFQRYCRRRFFPINRVICNPIEASDYDKYQNFLCRYLFTDVKKDSNANILLCRKVVAFSNATLKKLHYVAKYKNVIIGSVYLINRLSIDESYFREISTLIVLRSYQGFGIATKLVQAIVVSAECKKNVTYLVCDRKNFRAMTFYNKLGFKENRMLLKALSSYRKMDLGDNNIMLFSVI